MTSGLEAKPRQLPVSPEPRAVDNAVQAPTLSWSDDVLEEQSCLGKATGRAVHKVKDIRTGKIMARKTITTHEAPIKKIQELAVISSTEHVNVIRLYAAFVPSAFMSHLPNEVKILMEYCEGGSLEAVGKRIKEQGGFVDEMVAGRLAEGVVQGLAFLHTRGTIHRVIKPSNILLSREGIVKLSDFYMFGLANSVFDTFPGMSFHYMALYFVFLFTSSSDTFLKLTMDSQARPTPKEILAHPWIVGVMKQELDMVRWICKFWGWS